MLQSDLRGQHVYDKPQAYDEAETPLCSCACNPRTLEVLQNNPCPQ